MGLTVTTGAASGIDTNHVTLAGSFLVSPSTCCNAPCVRYAEKVRFGRTSPPTEKTVTTGTICGNAAADICSGGHAYNSTSLVLSTELGIGADETIDRTFYFRAVVTPPSGIGTCTGSEEVGSIVSFKTYADIMTFGTPDASQPADTSVQVNIDFNANCVESLASVKVQYKLQTEPVIWTDGTTISSLTGVASQNVSVSITGLAPSSAYDFRFVATRTSENLTSLTSAQGVFTTVAASTTENMAETASPTDAVSATITGSGQTVSDGVGITESVRIILGVETGTELGGAWFYHFPSQSYWFWTLQGFNAALAGIDGTDHAKTWVAIGSSVYLVDDETYNFDDFNPSEPTDTTGEFEMPLMFDFQGVDFQGRYAVPMSLDVKMGAETPIDPPGNVRIEVTSDQYTGADGTRRVLGTRTVPIAVPAAGIDEWRRFSLGRLRAVHAATVRLLFPRGQHPKRQSRIVINAAKLVVGITGLLRGRR